MSTAKAFLVTCIFLFFALLSYFSFYITDTYDNQEMVVSNFTINNYQNTSINNKPTALDSALGVLSIWDYLVRFIDIMFIGIVFYTSSTISALINIFLLTPIRIIFLWLIIELIRGV